jgi:hypothetical protein
MINQDGPEKGEEVPERIVESRKQDRHLVYLESPQTRNQVNVIRKWVELGG